MKRTFALIVVAAACGPSAPKQQTAPVTPAVSNEQPAAPAPVPAASSGVTGACKRSDMFGPYELSGEEMLQRRGLGDRLFSDTASSAEAPIQVCGVRGELTWLTNLTCADGSRPFGRELAKAHRARKGSSTGRRSCGTTVEPVPVDHYLVACPEKQYDVYMDMYECGPGEPFE